MQAWTRRMQMMCDRDPLFLTSANDDNTHSTNKHRHAKQAEARHTKERKGDTYIHTREERDGEDTRTHKTKGIQ